MNLVFVGLIGLLIFSWGIWIRLGHAKKVFLAKGIPVMLPQGAIYVNVPVGLLFICIELIASNLVPAEYRLQLFNFTIIPLLLLIIILPFWQPAWLLPDWLRYLRQTYGDRMTDAMLEEASKDVQAWLKQVETHEGLVQWADETAMKLRRPAVSYGDSDQSPSEE